MLDAIHEAGRLLLGLDGQLLRCVRVSLECSLAATIAAVVVGAPLAVLLGRKRFPGRRAVLVLANTGMAMPTVVIGLIFYALLSRSGPLGSMELLYTKRAIMIGQFSLALPMVIALFSASSAGLSPMLEKTARTLGARPLRVFRTILAEAWVPLVAASMAAFGRVVSELGIAMMLGGNIKGATRTMTTAIALETQKGEFSMGMALGLVLLLFALAVNAATYLLRLPTGRIPR